MKRAIAAGKIVIVAVGWETNRKIVEKIRKGEQPVYCFRRNWISASEELLYKRR